MHTQKKNHLPNDQGDPILKEQARWIERVVLVLLHDSLLENDQIPFKKCTKYNAITNL